MNDYSKLVAQIILALMTLGGLVIVCYDLLILNSSNFPVITGFLLGIPVTWAAGILGIHTGIDTFQQGLNNTTGPTSTTSTTNTPITTPSTSTVSSMKGQ